MRTVKATYRLRLRRGYAARTAVGFSSACLLVLGLTGGANAQSATSQLPIGFVVPPPAQAAALPPAAPPQPGPAASVLGSQVASTLPPAATKVPIEVLGETVAPAQVTPAFTGSDVAGPVRIALTLALAGTGLVLVTRKRRSSATRVL